MAAAKSSSGRRGSVGWRGVRVCSSCMASRITGDKKHLNGNLSNAGVRIKQTFSWKGEKKGRGREL